MFNTNILLNDESNELKTTAEKKYHYKLCYDGPEMSLSLQHFFTSNQLFFTSLQHFWTRGRADRGPINSVPSVRPSVSPSVRPRRAFLENASFNFSETWHEVRVPKNLKSH